MNKTILILFILALFSCKNDSKNLLIGKWEVVKFESQIELDEKQKEEGQRIIGAIIDFKENGKLVIEIDGETQESNWTVKDNTLIINNHTYIKIIELNKDEMILEGTLDYLDDGEVKTYTYVQTMEKV